MFPFDDVIVYLPVVRGFACFVYLPGLLHWHCGNHMIAVAMAMQHSSLRWRHNERDSVSNHQPNDCLLNRLFRRRSKKTSKLRVTGLCLGNSPGTGQMASNAENVSIWWRHHAWRCWLRLTDSWWRHQMETFPRYWPFVRGIHRSPVNSHHKGQWRGALTFSLICAWTDGWVNNRDAGDCDAITLIMT